MNGWVRKEGKAGEPYRVTASGARNLVVFSEGSIPTLETSHNGVDWHAVSLNAVVAMELYTHSVHGTGSPLLGSFFRVNGPATYYYLQED